MITEFDHDRINLDLEQLRELIERKQVLWEMATNQEQKDELAAEMAAHADMITQLKAALNG